MARPLILTGSRLEVPDASVYSDAVLLGPWCFAYRDDIRFEQQNDHELVPPAWNWAELGSARRTVDEIAERVCDAFFESLTSENSAAASGIDRNFVQRHFKGWFLLWIGVCLERFSRLENIQVVFPEERFVVRTVKDTPYVEQDLIAYFSKQVGHEYNHLLFSDLIRLMGDRWPQFEPSEIQDSWKEAYVNVDPGQTYDDGPASSENRGGSAKSGPTLVQRIKRKIIGSLRLMNFTILSDFHGRSLNFFERLWLQWKLNPGHLLFPVVSYGLQDRGIQASDWRRWTEFFQPKNDFEFILTKLLLKYMPVGYNEMYTTRWSGKKFRRVVMIGGDNYSPSGNDLCSEIRRAGGRVYTYQHGGGYGQYQAFANEDVERLQVDGFCTWGWADNQGACLPLPSPYLSELKPHSFSEDILILIGTMLPPVVYKLQTALSPEHLLTYIQDKKIFIEGLDHSIRLKLEYRAAQLDFGIREREQVEKLLPAEQISNAGKLTERLRGCRLAVFDHMSTSFLEGLAMNTPTILYWRPEYFGVNEETRAALIQLKRVGVYFDDAKEAALQVNRVWFKAEQWWSSEAVQEARRVFCSKYARTDRDWLRIWGESLKAELRRSGESGGERK